MFNGSKTLSLGLDSPWSEYLSSRARPIYNSLNTSCRFFNSLSQRFAKMISLKGCDKAGGGKSCGVFLEKIKSIVKNIACEADL